MTEDGARTNKENGGDRDGRLTVLLLLGGALLVYNIATLLQAEIDTPGHSAAQCSKLEVAGDRLQLGKCGKKDEKSAAREIPPAFTPFFFQPVKVNMADKEMLMTVKGIGPTIAEKILAYRQSFGSFAGIDDLERLEGVGRRKAEALAPALDFTKSP